MLEPQLPHNLERFNRLRFGQLGLVVAVPIVAGVFYFLAETSSAPEWVYWLAVPLVIAGLAGLGILETMKVLVFRRDQLESRERPKQGVS